MAFIDYYKILGVDKTIPQKDVKKAYLKRAKQFHPDLHPDDPKAKAKFQALNEAYDVINDPEKRRKYDQYGEQWKEADAYEKSGSEFRQGTNPFDGFDFSGFQSGGGGFSSFFEHLFGGRNAGHSTMERQATVELDLKTALLGGVVIIQSSDGEKLRAEQRYYWDTESVALAKAAAGQIGADHIKLMRVMASSPVEVALKVRNTDELLDEIIYITKCLERATA